VSDSETEKRGFTIVDKRGSAEAREPELKELPRPDFSGFLLSLATSALFHLGLVADPETGKPAPPNLPVARHTIDTLELLEEKTRGNLSDDEATLLRNLLTDLRMRFVASTRGDRSA
jgi:hypothetical protein